MQRIHGKSFTDKSLKYMPQKAEVLNGIVKVTCKLHNKTLFQYDVGINAWLSAANGFGNNEWNMYNLLDKIVPAVEDGIRWEEDCLCDLRRNVIEADVRAIKKAMEMANIN